MNWLAVLLLAVGVVLGRARPDHILSWAEDAVAPGWRTGKFWLGAPVVLVAVAAVWVLRPRRTLANTRSWRQDQRAHPTPRYDPAWASKRRDST
ncbi:hypothetical protein [Streptomyces sp. AD55]|uniref:hypothetical protein n=1 Tax=Streptomyces sp. AD55 TaxID=3242895 RepID=UPI0035295051